MSFYTHYIKTHAGFFGRGDSPARTFESAQCIPSNRAERQAACKVQQC
jgi:hypothetical protein